MNTRDLEYFISLTQIKNFSKVAHEFNVSQPTITFALQRLEREMDSRLIIRHRGQDLMVTDSGEQLLMHARAMIKHFQLARAEIANLKQARLVLGLPPTIEDHYFARVATRLKQANLIDRIDTIETGSSATLAALKNGEIDLALIGSINSLEEPTVISEEFDRRPFAIYVSKRHPLAKKRGVYFKDLKNEDFILFKSGFIHNSVINTMAKRNHFRPHVTFRSSGIHSILKMIRANVGISLLSTLISDSNPDIIKVDLLDQDVPKFVTSIVYRRSHRFNHVQTAILQQIRAALIDHSN
ncbi:LysR family transcriptional regulator [Nicoliella spurrieriana]|uniref:LysR family transcriptional regulator n=1 Tax=Nicoliella spurrieriana TaxID=2925830 RepID=A0A976X6F5_9LACO|nr:LysR family transcriptional regulator [Nicoliella spurrieriana]UQS87376.1 LysR family transcriptional regulator [Nicoliella spurrieriana]